MEEVKVSTIINDSEDQSALVVFTNGTSCRVPYVFPVPGPPGVQGPTGPMGLGGTRIDAIRADATGFVFDVTDCDTGAKRTLVAQLPVAKG